MFIHNFNKNWQRKTNLLVMRPTCCWLLEPRSAFLLLVYSVCLFVFFQPCSLILVRSWKNILQGFLVVNVKLQTRKTLVQNLPFVDKVSCCCCKLQSKAVLYWRPFFTKGCCPFKVISNWRPPSSKRNYSFRIPLKQIRKLWVVCTLNI